MIEDNKIDAFLSHHGVKGQHWGIRNVKNKIAKRQADIKNKEASAFLEKAKRSDTHISEIKKTFSSLKDPYEKEDAEFAIKNLERQKKYDVEIARKIKKSAFTPKQKKALLGTYVASTMLAVYGAGVWKGLHSK